VTTKRTVAVLVLVVLVGGFFLALPYARATALLIRVSNMTGTAGSFAEAFSYPVTKAAPHTVPTRQGDVPAQFYRPSKNAGRTLLLIPASTRWASTSHGWPRWRRTWRRVATW
jgi:hypothetical protein